METAKIDDRKRVRLPQGKPGQVVEIQDNGDGSFTLVPVKAVKRRQKPSILDGLKPFTKAEAERSWGPQTDGDESDRIAAAMCKVSSLRPEDLE